METSAPPVAGPFEARYLAFLETVVHLRPRLHRYCARMTGSALDGEDVVQDALLQAYLRLESYDETRPLAPWIYRIAHNRCIDVLRRRRVRRRAETDAGRPAVAAPALDTTDVGLAVEHLVSRLPPVERACVLLKDVLDQSLEEIAELTGSTVGAVKAALHRGRAKLARASGEVGPRGEPAVTPDVLRLYVERFTRRDWDGVRALVSAEARVRVADRFDGPLAGAPYFSNYDRLPQRWRLTSGHVDGEPVVLTWVDRDGTERLHSAVRLTIAGGRITCIVDYFHCGWVLREATVVTGD